MVQHTIMERQRDMRKRENDKRKLLDKHISQ